MLKTLSPGTLGIGILAILAGLAGAYVIRGRLAQEPPKTEAPRARTVPLASVDLPAGRVLTVGDVGLYSLTPEDMDKMKIDRGRAMMAPEQIIGRILREPVKRGQPFLSTALYLEGERPSFGDRLKPGLRAFSLQIPRERGGGLETGAKVDVLFRSAAARGDAVSQTLPIPELTVMLMSGVEILHVYIPPPPRTNAGPAPDLDLVARSRSNAPPPPLVTLAVTPEQASRLQAATGRGEITLIARPAGEGADASGRRPGALSLRDVLSLKPPTVILPNDFMTEIYRHKSREVNFFRDGRLIQQINSYQPAGAGAVGNSPDYRNDNAPPSTPPGPGQRPPEPEQNGRGQNVPRPEIRDQNAPGQDARGPDASGQNRRPQKPPGQDVSGRSPPSPVLFSAPDGPYPP
jgi:pilus assembly protein CpaB